MILTVWEHFSANFLGKYGITRTVSMLVWYPTP